jgi:hypothetical protein
LPVEFVPRDEVRPGDLVRVRDAASGPQSMLTVQSRDDDGSIVARLDSDSDDVVVAVADVLSVLRLV